MVNNRYDPAQLLNDLEDVDTNGHVDGQIIYWSDASGKWVASDVDELRWDETLKQLRVNKTTQTTRLLAGGIGL